MKGIVGVIAGVACAILIACSARPSQSTPSTTLPPIAPGTDPHGEIQALDAQIEAAVGQESQPRIATPSCTGADCGTAVAQSVGAMQLGDSATCHPAATPTCADSCQLASSICTSSRRICELAKQLPGDDWASGKCTHGTASCETASARCCGCR